MATIAVEDLVRSPAWFPVETLEGKRMRLVRLDEAAYRAASFLDQRLLVAGHEQSSCETGLLVAAARRLSPPPAYILHTGHVGSTLISRLIGEHSGLFSLREPAVLRAIALQSTTAGTEGLEVALALLGRTWRSDQRAVVKATSFVSELAESLLAAAHRPVAILMHTAPRTYLRTILAGVNSRAETAQLAPARLARLTRRLGALESPLMPGAEGERVAMSWLCEMSALQQAAQRFTSQVLWVDFDEFLADPRAGLQAIFLALGARPAEHEIESLVGGPLMRRYSKAPEHAYDTPLRREVLLSAEREHTEEIRRGMHWLEELAARFSAVQRVLDGPQRH